MVCARSNRASFDGRHTMRLLRESSIRCTTSACALPVITLGRLDHDWYEVRAVGPAAGVQTITGGPGRTGCRLHECAWNTASQWQGHGLPRGRAMKRRVRGIVHGTGCCVGAVSGMRACDDCSVFPYEIMLDMTCKPPNDHPRISKHSR